MHSKTWALASATLLFISCSNDFPAYSRLDRLRVLGVSADPPNPSTGQLCRLDALTFAPPDRPISFHWSFCPVLAEAKTGYTCPLTEASSGDLFGASSPFDLGTAETTSFINPFAADTLGNLCANGVDGDGYAAAVNCDQGYPVSILLDVATADDSLRAAFTVFLPASPEVEKNANPALLGLVLAGQALPDAPLVLSLPEGKAVDLSAQLSNEAIELRSIPPAEGAPGRRPERLTLSWFADAGSMDQDRTVFIDGETSIEAATRNRWTPPKQNEAPPGGLIHFATVVRDDRGGVGWLTRQLRLEVTP
jgi:hypothetical protein